MLGLVNNKFIIGKEEYYCISAEMHYYRVPKRYWAVCFERIKRAGFSMISTSVPWNLHEERIGDFDFFGMNDSRKDLIVFLELAREFGFKVILRCGPYIGAGWENGGIPDFILNDSELLARDSDGNQLTRESYTEKTTSYMPNYLHPRFANHIKRYYTAFVDMLQNYIYPKGPIFLFHIDDDLSFGRRDAIFDGDYSDFMINKKYYPFLEEKYENIQNLNATYGKEFKEFIEVEPPTEISVNKSEDLPYYFDWIEFKEKAISEYVNIVRERLESLGVGSLFSTGISVRPYFGLPVNWLDITNHKVSMGLNIEQYDNYHQISRQLRYLSSTSNFNWSPKLISGKWADDPKSAAKYDKVDNRAFRFTFITALASGLKGFISYMFVERDHWHSSPIAEDGSVRDNYEIWAKINEAIPKMKLENLRGFAQVGVAYDRSLLWYKYLGIDKPFPDINYLLDFSLPGICRGFDELNYDYSVVDTNAEKSFEGLNLVFVPISEFMAEETQLRILRLIKEGANIVLVGLMPKYNEKLKLSQALSKGLGITTKSDFTTSKIQIGNNNYDTQIFGSITKKKTEWKVFAKWNKKIVGAYKKYGRGTCYLLTFDPGITYDRQKVRILEQMLSSFKITTPVYSSEPNVNVFVQSDRNKTLSIFVINHNQRYEYSHPDNVRRVLIKIDPSIIKASGGARLKLVDPLGEDSIPVTPKQLGEGIVIEIENMDGKILILEKR